MIGALRSSQLHDAAQATKQKTTMKTEDEKVESILNHKNWTGLSLAELVDAGRIAPNEQKVIWSFTTAALGDPANMDEWREMRKIDKLVSEELAQRA